MAGHSKFKNIMHRKGAQDKKRAKIFTKLVREICIAAKLGGIDPEFNPRLRVAIAAAKDANMPKDRIDNALKKADSSNDSDNYTEMRYEGYGPGGTAFIVEALTDNKNRTASEVRRIFSKHGGNLGESGSVAFMFNRIGSIVYQAGSIDSDLLMEKAIELGAVDCVEDEGFWEVITAPEDVHSTAVELEKSFGAPMQAKVIMRPLNYVEVSPEDTEKVAKLIDALEDNDDVQEVIGNYILQEDK